MCLQMPFQSDKANLRNMRAQTKQNKNNAAHIIEMKTLKNICTQMQPTTIQDTEHEFANSNIDYATHIIVK